MNMLEVALAGTWLVFWPSGDKRDAWAGITILPKHLCAKRCPMLEVALAGTWLVFGPSGDKGGGVGILVH